MKFKENRSAWKVIKDGVGSSYRSCKKLNRTRAKKKTEKKKDKAMLDYRHARSSNSNDAKKEELKIAMRKAKHKFKNAERLLQEIKDQIQEKKDLRDEMKGPRK